MALPTNTDCFDPTVQNTYSNNDLLGGSTTKKAENSGQLYTAASPLNFQHHQL